MQLSHQEMDALIDRHFGYEASDDVEGVLASLTDDVRHEVIPSPLGAVTGKGGARSLYEMMFASIRGESVTPLRRLYGDGFVVDEALWQGFVEDGRPFLLDGRSGPVSFRLLHIFELRDGLVASETVWCDLAAIQRQLGAAPAPEPAAEAA